MSTLRNGNVVAVNHNGELFTERLVRDGGKWWFSSGDTDQRHYPRKASDERCIIISKVIHTQSETI